MSANDIHFMQRALELAEKGRGNVSPNPMVGCVIVHDQKIIGEGWHRKYGEAHAEVNAVASVENKALLTESTCYVSLEPCAHHGKTPPCADMLVRHQLKRVVVAVKDSNPLVGGKGIARMRSAGIQVDYGLLEEEARALNARFFTMMEKDRPFVLLKWAETADGFVARENFDSKWISEEQSRQLVHQWRAQEDAIMVGTNTARYDDPRLNVRGVEGKDPVRIVIDKVLQLPHSLHLFDQSQPTIRYNLLQSGSKEYLEQVQLPDDDFLRRLLADLKRRNIQSVLVEGGAQLLKSFIEAGWWDEARVFRNKQRFGGGISAPVIDLNPTGVTHIGEDELSIYHNPEPN